MNQRPMWSYSVHMLEAIDIPVSWTAFSRTLPFSPALLHAQHRLSCPCVRHGVYKNFKEQKSAREVPVYMGVNFFVVKMKVFGQTLLL